MSRKPRLYSEKGIYHVIMRGNNQQNLFHDDLDRIFFLKRIEKYSQELGIHIYAYCLMNNHVHILLGNAEKCVSLFVQKCANSYVYYFNRKYDRTGHLFQGRFKSEVILDEEYFKTVFRYIIQNTDNAGLQTYKKYKWNSYRAIFLETQNTFIDVIYLFQIFGGKKQLLDFLCLLKPCVGMEFENKKTYSDERASLLIQHLFGFESLYSLQRMSLVEQKNKCSILRQYGLSVSQISRITGISKAIIKVS